MGATSDQQLACLNDMSYGLGCKDKRTVPLSCTHLRQGKRAEAAKKLNAEFGKIASGPDGKLIAEVEKVR